MASFTSSLLFLLLFLLPEAQSGHPTEPACYDGGESSDGGMAVLEGEVGWLSCPLFSHPSVYNYTSAQSLGHNLFWYRLLRGHELEQPITYSSRLSKDRERLWLQPAVDQDSGLYICMWRNKSSCSKISMRLKVLLLEDVVLNPVCGPLVATPSSHQVIPLQQSQTLDCPDLQDAAKMADGQPTVSWKHLAETGLCYRYPFWSRDRQQRGSGLEFHIMAHDFQGLYFCTVSYLRRGKALNFTRSINVSATFPDKVSKLPSILQPLRDHVLIVRPGSEVRLVCRGLFPYLESPWDMRWTVDGSILYQQDQRFSTVSSLVKEDYRVRTEELVLLIQNFSSEDLKREFNCTVRNQRGFETRRVLLEVEATLPSLELGCGLALTLVLMLVLFVVYHVFWLEMLLIYRSWFGSDERHTDDKEYDVYISYARSSEDEQFVLSTLRDALENDFGYTVCIFDRDSLPGGTITDETLSFVARSRRLLVVVSPSYARRGSQALLELKAGIDGMALGGHLRVILVQYKPVRWRAWVTELRRARVALVLVRWQGEESRELTSHFWKRLRVELPVRRGRGQEEGRSKEAALMRLYSQNSTNSQTGLITDTAKDPRKVLMCAS